MEQSKTADKQRFNFIYIIRLPQNRPQALALLGNWVVQRSIPMKNLHQKYQPLQIYDTFSKFHAVAQAVYMPAETVIHFSIRWQTLSI
jgi:hypothetical protein